MRLLITGSAGVIGTVLAGGLGSRHQLRGFDIVPTPGMEDAVVGDIRDDGAVHQAMAGMDAVIHLVNVGGSWESCRHNMTGIHNVLEAARQHGIDRVACASRARMQSGTLPAGTLQYTVDMPLRPDNFYSLSKVFAEHIGYMYSVQFGIGFVAVRIGNLRADRETPVEAHHLSHADCIDCFDRAVTHSGGGFEIVYAVSDSPRRPYDLEHGRQAIGYFPRDWSKR